MICSFISLLFCIRQMEFQYKWKIVAATGYQADGKWISLYTIPQLVLNMELFHLSILHIDSMIPSLRIMDFCAAIWMSVSLPRGAAAVGRSLCQQQLGRDVPSLELPLQGGRSVRCLLSQIQSSSKTCFFPLFNLYIFMFCSVYWLLSPFDSRKILPENMNGGSTGLRC